MTALPHVVADRPTQENFDALVAAVGTLAAGGGGGGGGAAVPNLFIQQTAPVASPPYVWFEVDSGGSLVSIWVSA